MRCIYSAIRTDGRNVAHHRKQARRFSDPHPDAETSLRGGLASLENCFAKAIDYWAPVMGHSVAAAG